MSKEAFNPRRAPEYLALIKDGEFTAAELEPLLAVLPQGSTVGFVNDDSDRICAAILPKRAAGEDGLGIESGRPPPMRGLSGSR